MFPEKTAMAQGMYDSCNYSAAAIAAKLGVSPSALYSMRDGVIPRAQAAPQESGRVGPVGRAPASLPLLPAC